MLSVKKVSELTGISIRTLRYYDEIGLLKPSEISDSGYRYYDEKAIERLQQILLFRELEFPLKAIKEIIDSPNFNREEALEHQIELLTLKKEHLENVILFARGIKFLGVKAVDFSVFNTGKLDEYAKEAKEKYGSTAEYKEFEEKSKNRTQQDEERLSEEIMTIFAEFGSMKDLPPESNKVQSQVKTLQDFMTDNFYKCTPEVLKALGKMYSGGGDFTKNIDSVGGNGTAEFVTQAINVFCDKEI